MDEKNSVRWTQLLKLAVEEPGIVSEAYSVFHDYSIGNQMLVMWQCVFENKKVGPIAGYRKWQELGRQVQKGEKALAIWIPITWKKNVEKDDGTEIEETRISFKVKNCVFTSWQTEGDEFQWPETPGWDREKASDALNILEKEFDETNGNIQGYASRDGKIAINPIAEKPMKTWLHEAAHHRLGHSNGREKIAHDIREMEAEAVAMLVSDALKLDGIQESRGYIQSWWGKNEIPEESARKIFSAANEILEAGR